MWAALELMLCPSSSVVALAKKMVKPETKTVTRTVAVPKTKKVKQQSKSVRFVLFNCMVDTVTDWHSETLHKYFSYNTTHYSKRRKNVLFMPLANL
jgi:type II secretory pathway component PulL